MNPDEQGELSEVRPVILNYRRNEPEPVPGMRSFRLAKPQPVDWIVLAIVLAVAILGWSVLL